MKQFAAAIKPFRSLWRSVRVAGLAAKRNEHWVSIGVRLTFGEDDPRGSLRIIREIENFLAFDIELPIGEMGYVLRSLMVEGRIPVVPIPAPVLTEPVFLSKSSFEPQTPSNRPLHWDAPFRSDRPQSKQYFNLDRTFIRTSATLDRIYDVLPYELSQQINWRVGQETEFDGLDDLGKGLIPGWTASSDSRNAEIVAVLPFHLTSDSPASITVRAPAAAFAHGLNLKLTYKPEGGSLRVRLSGETALDESGMISRSHAFEWPHASELAKVTLYFSNQMVDSIEVGRWDEAATARLAINSYFDPGHKYLKQFLAGTDQNRGKSRQELFEIGVMRLLGLFGVPAVWYGGGGAADQRPDGAGIIQDQWGRKRVLLIECTIDKPLEKLTALSARSTELAAHLGKDVEVVPVLFLQCEPLPPEVAQAEDGRIALIGKSRIDNLIYRLDGHLTKTDGLADILSKARYPNPFRTF